MSKCGESVQVALVRREGDSVNRYVAWIPRVYAVRGNVLRIDGAGDCDWVVEDVYGPARPSAEVADRSRDHLRQRRASDV